MPRIDIDRVKNQTRTFFNGFTSGQKVMTGVLLLTLIVGGYLFMKWESKPSYTPLFSNLTTQDASAITDQLKAQNVDYQLSDGGQTVLVPQSQVYQLRLDMSKQGLPTGGNEGYTLLDKEGVTTSEFRQRVDYQRALEGELAKTIGAMDTISGASVHLVIPQQDVFVSDAQKSSASVLIETKGGAALSSGAGPGDRAPDRVERRRSAAGRRHRRRHQGQRPVGHRRQRLPGRRRRVELHPDQVVRDGPLVVHPGHARSRRRLEPLRRERQRRPRLRRQSRRPPRSTRTASGSRRSRTRPVPAPPRSRPSRRRRTTRPRPTAARGPARPACSG